MFWRVSAAYVPVLWLFLAFFNCVQSAVASDNRPPLLSLSKELECAPTVDKAKSLLSSFKGINMPGKSLPNEWFGSDQPLSLHAGSLDIALYALSSTSRRFPEIAMDVEQVILQWNYCDVLLDNTFYDVVFVDNSLEKRLAFPDSVINWKGFNSIGFLGEHDDRLALDVFKHDDAPFVFYELDYSTYFRMQCLPHPQTSELYYSTKTYFPWRVVHDRFDQSTDYPFNWKNGCEVESKEQDALLTDSLKKHESNTLALLPKTVDKQSQQVTDESVTKQLLTDQKRHPADVDVGTGAVAQAIDSGKTVGPAGASEIEELTTTGKTTATIIQAKSSQENIAVDTNDGKKSNLNTASNSPEKVKNLIVDTTDNAKTVLSQSTKQDNVTVANEQAVDVANVLSDKDRADTGGNKASSSSTLDSETEILNAGKAVEASKGHALTNAEKASESVQDTKAGFTNDGDMVVSANGQTAKAATISIDKATETIDAVSTGDYPKADGIANSIEGDSTLSASRSAKHAQSAGPETESPVKEANSDVPSKSKDKSGMSSASLSSTGIGTTKIDQAASSGLSDINTARQANAASDSSEPSKPSAATLLKEKVGLAESDYLPKTSDSRVQDVDERERNKLLRLSEYDHKLLRQPRSKDGTAIDLGFYHYREAFRPEQSGDGVSDYIFLNVPVANVLTIKSTDVFEHPVKAELVSSLEPSDALVASASNLAQRWKNSIAQRSAAYVMKMPVSKNLAQKKRTPKYSKDTSKHQIDILPSPPVAFEKNIAPVLIIDETPNPERPPEKPKKAEPKQPIKKKYGFSGSFSLNNKSFDSDGFNATAAWSYKPIKDSYWFVRSSWNYRLSDKEFRYTWGIGYDDWHPGTFAFQLNHWGPLLPGDYLDLDNAIASVTYKFKKNKFMEKNKVSSSVTLSQKISGDPVFSWSNSWSPKGKWFVRSTISQPLKGGDPSWSYGFGRTDYSAFTFSFEYNNWGYNKAFEDNFKDNGLLSLTYRWQF